MSETIPAIPLVAGGRVYAVPSKSEPGVYRIVDLSRGTCTCPACKWHPEREKLCQPQKDALAAEALVKQLQAAMPIVTAHEMKQVTKREHLPRVPDLSDDELQAIFA